MDNKPCISQSENEFLKRSVLKNLCHKAEHPFLELFFGWLGFCFFFLMQIPLQSIYVLLKPLKHKHCGECKSTCWFSELQLRESEFRSLYPCCCCIAVQ